MNNKIHIYLDRIYTGARRYSYIVECACKHGDEWVSSMPVYETSEEAKIAAELYLERHDVKFRDTISEL